MEEQERARGKRIWAIERERERRGSSTEEGEGGVALGVGEIGTGGKDIIPNHTRMQTHKKTSNKYERRIKHFC